MTIVFKIELNCNMSFIFCRFAKHMIDDKNFFGGSLHVCYAPELESLSETRQKLIQRKRDILRRINSYDKQNQMYGINFFSFTIGMICRLLDSFNSYSNF